MSDLWVPDVSHYQGTIDWAALGAACPIVIVKAANGTHADPRWADNRDGARTHCQVRIWYQYLVPDVDAALQARALMSIVGPLRGDEAMSCDLEEGAGDQSPRLDAWNSTIPGDTELDYSGLAFFTEHLADTRVAFHRWIAAYRATEPAMAHDLWQATDHRRFPGIAGPCDASLFHGTVDDFRRRLGLISPHPIPTPGGPLMALTDAEQTELLEKTRENNVMLKQQQNDTRSWVGHTLGWARAIGARVGVAQADAIANDPSHG